MCRSDGVHYCRVSQLTVIIICIVNGPVPLDPTLINPNLSPPEPLGEGGQELHYFLLGDNVFTLMPGLVEPYNTKQLIREERVAKHRISKGRRV